MGNQADVPRVAEVVTIVSQLGDPTTGRIPPAFSMRSFLPTSSRIRTGARVWIRISWWKKLKRGSSPSPA